MSTCWDMISSAQLFLSLFFITMISSLLKSTSPGRKLTTLASSLSTRSSTSSDIIITTYNVLSSKLGGPGYLLSKKFNSMHFTQSDIYVYIMQVLHQLSSRMVGRRLPFSKIERKVRCPYVIIICHLSTRAIPGLDRRAASLLCREELLPHNNSIRE